MRWGAATTVTQAREQPEQCDVPAGLAGEKLRLSHIDAFANINWESWNTIGRELGAFDCDNGPHSRRIAPLVATEA